MDPYKIAKRVGERSRWTLPYLWDTRTMRTLCRACLLGTRQIIIRTWRWCRDPNGDRDTRWAVPAAAGILSAWAVYRQPAYAPTGLAMLWLVSALKMAPAGLWDAPPSEHPEDFPEDGGHPPEPTLIPASEWVRLAIGEANGIHLSDLLDLAHSNGQHLGLDYAAFKAALEARGVPVRKNLKVAGRNRPGIARADLPPAPTRAHSPEEAQEGADPRLPVA